MHVVGVIQVVTRFDHDMHVAQPPCMQHECDVHVHVLLYIPSV